MLIDRFYVNAPLDKPTIIKLPAPYRTDIVRNPLGLLEGRLMYYELISTVTKHICRIVVPTSLCYTIFNLIHAIHISRKMG